MVDFAVTLWFYLCVLCSFLSLLCRIVVVLCPPSAPLTFNALNILNHLLAMLSPPSFLSPFHCAPSFSLDASSHIHLPVLCLCLSILWCVPRRHGRKVDELRSVPSQPSHPPFFNSCPSTHLPSSPSSFLSLLAPHALCYQQFLLFTLFHFAVQRLFVANIYGFFATVHEMKKIFSLLGPLLRPGLTFPKFPWIHFVAHLQSVL